MLRIKAINLGVQKINGISSCIFGNICFIHTYVHLNQSKNISKNQFYYQTSQNQKGNFLNRPNKKITKKFDNKVIDSQYFHRKTGLEYYKSYWFSLYQTAQNRTLHSTY